MSIKEAVATEVKSRRENTGLSQDKVAAKANLSTRFYRSVESGEKMPSINTVFKIAKALDIHYSVLLEQVWEYWCENPHLHEEE